MIILIWLIIDAITHYSDKVLVRYYKNLWKK